MDKIYSHMFSVFTEEQQENEKKGPRNQIGKEQMGHTLQRYSRQ